jgi:hypothetical protein
MSHHVDPPSGPIAVRLCLRPAAARAGPVLDGGWWPRTHEPIRELTSLLPVVRGWCGQLRVVSLSVAGWDDRPLHLVLDGQPVPLHWLGLYRDLLIATCVDHRQVRLLVIPPDTGQTVADTAMAIALDPDNHAAPPLILARAARPLNV